MSYLTIFSVFVDMMSQSRFVKADQAQLLQQEYERLGRPLDKCPQGITELVRKVEIELSKNQTFKVLNLGASAYSTVSRISSSAGSLLIMLFYYSFTKSI